MAKLLQNKIHWNNISQMDMTCDLAIIHVYILYLKVIIGLTAPIYQNKKKLMVNTNIEILK